MGDAASRPFDWAAFEMKTDNSSKPFNAGEVTDSQIVDDFNSDRHYRIGIFVKKFIYAYGSLALYFDETDKIFKFCYSNGRGNCKIQDYGNLVLMEGVKDANASYVYSLKDLPILTSLDDISDGEFRLVLEQKGDGKHKAYICRGNERIRLTNNESDLLLLFVLKTIKKEDQQKAEFSKIGVSKHKYYSAIRTFETEVRKYDLNKILEDLHVYVEEDFVSRVGRDDYYYVYKTVSIGYPEDELDDYLKAYIGLGRRCIHEEHGYTSAYSMAIKDLITGEYDAENLKKEKEKLISEYSIQEHVYYLLYQYVTNAVFPKGLRYPSHVSNAISLERNSLLPLYWKLLRSKKITEYIDELDSRNTRRELNMNSLAEINGYLADFSRETKAFRDTDCWESDPEMTIF